MPRRPAPTLTVTFHKATRGGRALAWWDAVRPTGGRFSGGHMPIGHGVIPHDLGHMATEAHLAIDGGFWGLLARGATFKGTHRRATKPGRAIIRDHRSELDAAEALGNAHHMAWARGEATPVGPTFDRLAAMWRALPDGGTLTIVWPSLEVIGHGASAGVPREARR